MNPTAFATIQIAINESGITSWTAFCDCISHDEKPWVRISPDNLAKVAYLLQADPFTPKGAKAINHDVLNRLVNN